MKIKPYKNNPKKHPKKQIAKVAESIKAFGCKQPIVVDKAGVIVVGHARYLAFKKLGISKIKKAGFSKKGDDFIPIILADELSEEEVKAYRIADNKLNESPWDVNLAIEELGKLSGEMFDLTGFDKDFIIEVQEDDFDAQKEYEKIKKPKTREGNLYHLGCHRLLCGDSTKKEDYKKLLNKDLARLIFTDPPYNVDYKSPAGLDYTSKKYGGSGGAIFNDKKSDKDCLIFYTEALKNLHSFSSDDASIYWWFAMRNAWINQSAFKESKWHLSQTIIWVKNGMVFSRGQDFHRMYEPCFHGWKKGKKHYTNKQITNLRDLWNLDFDDFQEMFDVWYEKRDALQDYEHPTQKPVRLAERALKKNSEVNDIVLDVFGGSGSTLIACEQLKRRCCAMELDPKYCDVIVKRFEKFTCQKAKLI
ncbi:MAG: DNA modification methylase [Patescibacteria group bacterium]|nr:DNA modification methylase [Patescibacteria group bacterium]